MYNNLNNKFDDYELAINKACKEFEKIHPKETQPEWLKYCISMKVFKNENKNWVIRMLLTPKYELEPNQYWKREDNGIPILVQVDSEAEKESIVICGGTPIEPEIIFEVEVDFAKELPSVNIDTDLSELNGTKYEMNIRY